MIVLWIVYVNVIDVQVYGEYVKLVGLVIVVYGGVFLVCGLCYVQFEGNDCVCNVVVCFFSVEDVVVCYCLVEYQVVLEYVKNVVECDLVIVEEN